MSYGNYPPQGGYPAQQQPAQMGGGYPGYGSPYPPQAYAAPMPAPAASPGLMKICSILILLGFVIAGIGVILSSTVVFTISSCVSSPSGCSINSASAEAGAINEMGVGILLAGIGTLLAGIGFGLYFLQLPKLLAR
jgi:hypothetical protein